MYIYKAGVVGAGAMGAGIAQVISFSGLPVVLTDISGAAVAKGMDSIRKIYQNRVSKGKMTAQDMEQKLLLVTATTSKADFKDVDIVVEAVPEVMAVKKKVFVELDAICQPSAIFASNTSALSISELAASTRRPEKTIGMHFFNPPHVMKLVEVIPGIQTSAESVDDVVSFTESLRKIPVRVEECAGFLVNRLLMPYINEAFLALEEGVATAQEIDSAMAAFGMPMGPFTLTDMLGVDICHNVAEILYSAYGERMRPSKTIGDLIAAKRFGVKNGAGVYIYDGRQAAVAGGLKGQPHFEIERLLYPMVNEAIIASQEHVAALNDIDIAMIAGTGFPQEKGGPLHYADTVGLDILLSKLLEYEKRLGGRFHPAPMLKRYVSAGLLGVKAKRGFFHYP